VITVTNVLLASEGVLIHGDSFILCEERLQQDPLATHLRKASDVFRTDDGKSGRKAVAT
jgi:hypothetical protein